MKTLWTFLRERPWLLVVLAFVILISSWSTLIALSAGVPSRHLTAEEEKSVLKGRPTP